LGGKIEEVSKGTVKGFHLTQGIRGIPFALFSNFDTYVVVKNIRDDKYEIEVLIRWSLRPIYWLSLLIFCWAPIFWIVPILFFSIDPTQAYQQVIDRVQASLQ